MTKGTERPLYRLKYYVAIAQQMRIVSEMYEDDAKGLSTVNIVVDSFVYTFSCDNPLFKEAQFRELCGDFIRQDCIIHTTTGIAE